MNYKGNHFHLGRLVAVLLMLGIATIAQADSIYSEKCGIKLSLDKKVTYKKAEYQLDEDMTMIVDTYASEFPQKDNGVIFVFINCQQIKQATSKSEHYMDPRKFMTGLKGQLQSYEIIDEFLGEVNDGLYRYSIDAVKNKQDTVIMGFVNFKPSLYHQVSDETSRQASYAIYMMGLKKYEAIMSEQMKEMFVSIMSNNKRTGIWK